jgi:hypothetical protein
MNAMQQEECDYTMQFRAAKRVTACSAAKTNKQTNSVAFSPQANYTD